MMSRILARLLRRALVALGDSTPAECRREALREAMAELLAGPRRSAATLATASAVLGAALRSSETTEREIQ
jgi:hypothetical protein